MRFVSAKADVFLSLAMLVEVRGFGRFLGEEELMKTADVGAGV